MLRAGLARGRVRRGKELVKVAKLLDGQLTATVHGEPSDEIVPELLEELAEKAGRVIWNGWPTGVSVTWAMQHGGPYPATTAPLHTSVGAAAVARFLRPVAYQGVPDHFLPPALRDAQPARSPPTRRRSLRARLGNGPTASPARGP